MNNGFTTAGATNRHMKAFEMGHYVERGEKGQGVYHGVELIRKLLPGHASQLHAVVASSDKESIAAAPVVNSQLTFTAQSTQEYSRVETGQCEDTYVAWVYGSQFVSGRSSSLARLALREEDRFQVYTDHNQ